jgi:hypothetical protein
MKAAVEPTWRSDQAGSPQTDFRTVNLSFIPDTGSCISPLNRELESDISEYRRELFQNFENRVIKPFAEELLSTDAEGVVRVAGSYNDPHAKVRLSSDVDVLVLSEALKEPEKYLYALLSLANSAQAWREDMAIKGGVQVEPYFFTRAITEEDKFALILSVSGCQEKNIIPCHFLYYRDEAELVQREEMLGHRLLGSSRAVLNTRSSSDAVFLADSIAPLSGLEGAAWDIERAMAELVLNHSLMPARLIVRGYANQIYQLVRRLADILPLPDEQKTTECILRLLDLDRGDGLIAAFRPIEALRVGAPVGDKTPLVPLLTPAVEVLKSLNFYMRKS